MFHLEESWSSLKMAVFAKRSAYEFLTISKSCKSTLCIDDRHVWKPPPPNVTTLNCDASVFVNRDLAGFDCILRNSDGTFLKACFERIQPAGIFCCEMFAIWRGLVLAWECDVKDVICQTDNLEVFIFLHNTADLKCGGE
ncbi:hypothetical protein PIB30_030618 [Stylosanthes scabra]|uniref:RNase H type-1 domain-containing protein n=1 Tax=Stylosanthes scabra TaxID=79078 RepID=A0ABU6XBU0_9FABA|nr:hypothetical protein [Stylosanthes scabra]